MGNPQLGLIVLGSIVGALAILAIVVHYGKKYHEEKESERHSLNKC